MSCAVTPCAVHLAWHGVHKGFDRSTVWRILPAPPAVPDSQQFDLRATHTVDNQIRGFAHYLLTRALDMAGPPHMGLNKQSTRGFVDALGYGLGGERIVLCDMFLGA